MRLRGAATAIATALLLAAVPAGSRDWPTVGWFDIVEVDDGCAAAAQYEFDGRHDVYLMIVLGTDDKVLASVTSVDWTARQGTKYDDIAWELNGKAYTGASLGFVTDVVRHGFITRFGPEFLDDFGKGSSLYIKKGEDVVTHINLYSSGKAVAVLRQCVASMKAVAAAKDKAEKKWDYIDKDPFANKQ